MHLGNTPSGPSESTDSLPIAPQRAEHAIRITHAYCTGRLGDRALGPLNSHVYYNGTCQRQLVLSVNSGQAARLRGGGRRASAPATARHPADKDSAIHA